MNNEKNLRAFVGNESLGTAQRRDAAEMLVGLKLNAVPEPADDDPEVAELRTPWPDDASLGAVLPMAWRQRNIAYGWPSEGPSVAQARKHIHKRVKLRALLAVVVDEKENRLVRLAACDAVVREHSPKGALRNVHKSAEEMLSAVKPSTASKWVAGPNGFPEQVLVSRPPQSMADVW